jgi:hypothetical protein
MKTNENSRPPGGVVVVTKEAYGRLVEKLLDQQTGSTWKRDLFGIFAGYINNQHANDKSVNLAQEFWTFRDLIFFFDEIEALQAGKEVGQL